MNYSSGILFMAFTILILIVCVVLPVIGNWKIFVKAGEPGWKALIPIYYSYILFKIAWNAAYFAIYTLLTVVAIGIILTAPIIGSGLSMTLFFILYGCLMVLRIIFCFKLAKAFDHGIFFAVALILLGPIFMIVQGFDSSEYEGPQ